jgi:predicted SprT family Zn-dependent metalloprotease
MESKVGAWVYVSCECGRHLAEDSKVNDNESVYECVDCRRPLLIRGADGYLYLVGGRIL